MSTPDGRRVVVTVHGGGVFGSPERIAQAFRMDNSSMTGQYAAKLSDHEAQALLRGELPDGTKVPMYDFDEFKGIANLPVRYGVVLDMARANQSKRGYDDFSDLRNDPLFIVHAGGVEQASVVRGKVV